MSYTDEEMLAAIRAEPEAGCDRFRGPPSAETIRQRFGSWNAARRAAGLPARGRGEYSRSGYSARMRARAERLAAEVRRGRTIADVAEEAGTSGESLRRRFRRWGLDPVADRGGRVLSGSLPVEQQEERMYDVVRLWNRRQDSAAIAAQLGVTRATVYRYLRRARRAGWRVAPNPGRHP